MKYLVTSSFAHHNPWYLISSYLRFFVYPTDKFRKFIFGVGRPRKDLFGPGLFDGIEFDSHHADIFFYKNWEIEWSRVDAFKRQGINIGAVHGHYPLGAKVSRRGDKLLNLGLQSANVRRAIKSHIELTASLIEEKRLLVFHPGMVPQNTSQEEALKVVIDNLMPCLSFAKEKNVFICLENVNPSSCQGLKTLGADFNFFKALFEKLDHPNLRIVFDWGHANSYARKYYDENRNALASDYLTTFKYHREFIDSLNKKIVYAHLNYNPAHDISSSRRKHPFVVGWDYHMDLTRIPDRFKTSYKEIIKYLVDNTSIRDFGKLTFEIVPDNLFRVRSLVPFGCSNKEAIESLNLLKSWIKS